MWMNQALIHIPFFQAGSCGETATYHKLTHTLSPLKIVHKYYSQIHTHLANKLWIKCYLLKNKKVRSG